MQRPHQSDQVRCIRDYLTSEAEEGEEVFRLGFATGKVLNGQGESREGRGGHCRQATVQAARVSHFDRSSAGRVGL